MNVSKIKKIIYTIKPAEWITLIFFIIMVFLIYKYDRSIFKWDDINRKARVFLGAMLLLPAFLVIMNPKKLKEKIRLLAEKKYVISSSKIIKSSFFLLRDWLPLLIALWVYDTLHDLTRLINNNDYDWLFIAMDYCIFLGNHPTEMLNNMVHPLLSKWMAINYSLYFLYFPLTLGILYFSGLKKAFHQTMLMMVLVMYSGFILYIIFPCVGPVLAQHDLHTNSIVNDGIYSIYEKAKNLYMTKIDYFHCFPSLHFAMSATFWYAIWKYRRKLFWIYAPFVISLWFSTVYLRWHYVVDLLGGLILVILAAWLGPKIYKSWEKFTKN